MEKVNGKPAFEIQSGSYEFELKIKNKPVIDRYEINR